MGIDTLYQMCIDVLISDLSHTQKFQVCDIVETFNLQTVLDTRMLLSSVWLDLERCWWNLITLIPSEEIQIQYFMQLLRPQINTPSKCSLRDFGFGREINFWFPM
jgi:hypothetical protein